MSGEGRISKVGDAVAQALVESGGLSVIFASAGALTGPLGGIDAALPRMTCQTAQTAFPATMKALAACVEHGDIPCQTVGATRSRLTELKRTNRRGDKDVSAQSFGLSRRPIGRSRPAAGTNSGSRVQP